MKLYILCFEDGAEYEYAGYLPVGVTDDEEKAKMWETFPSCLVREFNINQKINIDELKRMEGWKYVYDGKSKANKLSREKLNEFNESLE